MPVVWWKWMRQGGMGQESCKSQEYIYRNVRRRCLTSLCTPSVAVSPGGLQSGELRENGEVAGPPSVVGVRPRGQMRMSRCHHI